MDNTHLELHQFLLDSNRAGYATGEEKQWIKETDGSTTIPYAKGEFKSHDNFFGGEPYGGRLVVFDQNRPIWIMVYYGWIEPAANTDQIYAILRQALQRMPEEAPFRGPQEYSEGNWKYTNSWDGTIKRYSGNEEIMENGVLVYQAFYRGGLVDQRGGL